jgi:hypothetical protein
MKIKIGDDVLIEQAWEDERGYYHDEEATISKIMSDNTLRFRIGHWKTRTQKQQSIQAYLNKQEWYAKDVTIL